VVRRMPQRPDLPGKLRLRIRAGSPFEAVAEF
jgi:hypothetical protein